MLKNEYFINYSKSSSTNFVGVVTSDGEEPSIEKSFLNFIPKDKLDETLSSLSDYIKLHVDNEKDMELSCEDRFLSRFYCLFKLITMKQSKLSDILNFGAIMSISSSISIVPNISTVVVNDVTVSLDIKKYLTLNLFEANLCKYNVDLSFSYDDESYNSSFNVEMKDDKPNMTMCKDLMLFLHRTQKSKVSIDKKNVFFLDVFSMCLDDAIVNFYKKLEFYTQQSKLSLDKPLTESIYL